MGMIYNLLRLSESGQKQFSDKIHREIGGTQKKPPTDRSRKKAENTARPLP